MLRTVLEVPVLAVLHPRQHLWRRGAVASQLVGNDALRHIGQALQQRAEKPLGRLLVTSALDEDIEDMAVLVDGAPEIVTGAVDRQEYCIEMPRVARPGTPAAQLVGISLPKRPAPRAHRVVRPQHAALGHELFDIAIAQAKAEVQPDTVADDLGREPMALIRIRYRW
jgi:hypothetical protein